MISVLLHPPAPSRRSGMREAPLGSDRAVPERGEDALASTAAGICTGAAAGGLQAPASSSIRSAMSCAPSRSSSIVHSAV